MPAPALADGFREGEATFLAGLRGEVAADARDRGLIQPRLRAGTRALLCSAALAPAAAPAAAFAPHHGAASLWCIFLAFGAACAVVTRAGARDVPSRAGRAALAAHRAVRRAEAGHPGADPHRVAAYAAALGRPGGATDIFPTRRCVAIDDGTAARAWAFTVTIAQYHALVPGTFVHVLANPRRNRPLSIQPTEPPPVASRLASVLEPRQPDPQPLPRR